MSNRTSPSVPAEQASTAPSDPLALGGTIDFHAHWWSPGLLESVSKLRGTPGLYAKWLPPAAIAEAEDVSDLGARIGLMDEAGISVQVLSGSNVGHQDSSVAADLQRCNNDGLSRGCEAYPSRFRFFGSLPLPFLEESTAEADRVSGLVGFAGFVLPTHIHGAPLDADTLVPLLEHLNEQRHIVFLHPDGFRTPNLLGDWMMDWSIGAPFEDTIAVVRLISSGRLEQFPEIRWLVPHLGGCLPVLVQRMDRMWPAFGVQLGTSAPLSHYLESLYFDTAASSVETLALAAKVMSSSSFVLGTDFPFLERRDMRASVRRVLECSALGRDRAHDILRPGLLSV
jgi:6-methylsalicylate decarboxylase